RRSRSPVREDSAPRSTAERLEALQKSVAAGDSSNLGATVVVQPAARWTSGEDAVFRIALGGGGRLLTNYAVVLGGSPSGLGYSLSPQAMAEAEARLAPFAAPLSFELGIAYVPIKYKLETMPAATPEQPIGNQLALHLRGAYAFELGPAVSIAALAG